MIDPVDVQSVIDRVTARLARRYWWMTKDDLASEAWIACNTTDVLSEATSPGAFYERLRGRLTASLETERKWREERIADVELVDVDDEGKRLHMRRRSGRHHGADLTWTGQTR